MESAGRVKKMTTKDAAPDGKKKKDALDAEKKKDAKPDGKRAHAKPALLQTSPSRSAKRPSLTAADSSPSKKDRPALTPRDQGRGRAQRGRGGSHTQQERGSGAVRGGLLSRSGVPRGRGGAAPIGRGRTLLPDPVPGVGEGLLPHPDTHHPPPLLALPSQPTVQGREWHCHRVFRLCLLQPQKVLSLGNWYGLSVP